MGPPNAGRRSAAGRLPSSVLARAADALLNR